MPTYEYECLSCGHVFEQFQNMSDEPLKKCPKCGKKVRRNIGAGAGIIFKGSGFYETDYKRKNAVTASSSSAPKTECPAASECADKDDKPCCEAAKSDKKPKCAAGSKSKKACKTE